MPAAAPGSAKWRGAEHGTTGGLGSASARDGDVGGRRARGGERGRRHRGRATAACSSAPARRPTRRASPTPRPFEEDAVGRGGDQHHAGAGRHQRPVHRRSSAICRPQRAPRHGACDPPVAHPSRRRSRVRGARPARSTATSTACAVMVTEVTAEAIRDAVAYHRRRRTGTSDQAGSKRSAVSLLEPSPFASFADLEREALACTKCPLAATRTQVVFGVGRPARRPDVRGRGSGRAGGPHGEPFVGRAGRLLTSLIEGIGLTRADVYIANVVKCRPPGNRDPQPARDRERAGRTSRRQLAFIEPRVVVTLGNFATKLLLDTKDGITKLRGPRVPVPRRRGAHPRVPPVGGAAQRRRRAGAGAGRLRRDQARRSRARTQPMKLRATTHDRRRDPRARPPRSARCCAPATSSCSTASSAPARPCSPRASPSRSASTEPVVSPTFTRRARVRRPDCRSCTSTCTASTTCRSCTTSGSTSSSASDAVTVVEWGDRVERAAPAPTGSTCTLGARRRRRRRPRRCRLDAAGRRVGRRARRALRRRGPGRLTCCVLAIDTATAQVSVAFGDDGRGARRGAARRRPPPRRAARARDRVPAPRARRRPRPPRRDRGRHRPGPVHRPARRRHHRQGDGAGAAHPGGRRARASTSSPTRCGTATGSSSRCSTPAAARCSAARYRPVPGGVQRVSDYAVGTPAELVAELAADAGEPDGAARAATASLAFAEEFARARARRAGRHRVRGAERRRARGARHRPRRARGVRAAGRGAPAVPAPERRRDRLGDRRAAR